MLLLLRQLEPQSCASNVRQRQDMAEFGRALLTVWYPHMDASPNFVICTSTDGAVSSVLFFTSRLSRHCMALTMELNAGPGEAKPKAMMLPSPAAVVTALRIACGRRSGGPAGLSCAATGFGGAGGACAASVKHSVKRRTMQRSGWHHTSSQMTV